jgi:MerR family redox-sensitive transcriptional activator SoxR
MSELTIGQVAKQCGLRASAIRYYEAEGLIPLGRRRGGRRVFDASVLGRLALIDLAKGSGFTISEIRKLVHGFSRRTSPGARWRALAADKLQELDERIEQAVRMKRVLQMVGGCECPTLEDCGKAMLREDDSALAVR